MFNKPTSGKHFQPSLIYPSMKARVVYLANFLLAHPNFSMQG